jgi:hypothetical protein
VRRPRIGNQIADALLTAAAELEDTLAEHQRSLDNDWYEDEEDAPCWQRELKVATEYIRGLANWYRKKKGVE